jgi:hypothetical protein
MKLFGKLKTATAVALALAATAPAKADEITYMKEFTLLGDVFVAQLRNSWVQKILPWEDGEYVGFLYLPGQGNNVVPAHGARLVFRLTGWSKEEIEKLAYECQADMPCRGRWHISNFRHIDGSAFGWVDAAADLEGVNDHYEAPADAPRYFYDGRLVTPESRAQKGVEGRQYAIAMKQHDEASRKYQTYLENQINLVYKRSPGAPPIPLIILRRTFFLSVKMREAPTLLRRMLLVWTIRRKN